MQFFLSDHAPETLEGNVLVVPIWENGHSTVQQMHLRGQGKADIKDLVSQAAKEEKFNGELGKYLFLPIANALPYKRLLLVGLGKQHDLDAERVRRFAAWAVRSAETVSAERIVFDLEYFKKLDMKHIIHALVEGAELGGYKFLKYKGEASLQKMKVTNIATVVLCGVDKRRHASLESVIRVGQLFAKATMTARDLANEPAMTMTPGRLLESAQKIVKENSDISLTFYNREGARKLGMNAFLGVASGSAQEPYFVHLEYKPPGAKKRIAMVGKAVTFDSGGLSIKPVDAMYDMKIDMSGAANVLGVFSVLSELRPKVHIDGIFAACENMPSGSAIKPGDIVRALNGKTIEVLNTDAEGRVCLADALSYAVRLKPDFIIDFATLTGAAMVSLGEEVCTALSNNKKFYETFVASCEIEGEKTWELPLVDDYRKKLESAVADLKNIADNRWGGAITAALFLQEFVDNLPWIHLDIAGPSGVWTQFHQVPYIQQGGTGFGVRSFLNYVLKNF